MIALSINSGNTLGYLTRYSLSYKLRTMKNSTISERLNLAMQARGITQGALAKASGVAQPTIWRLTSGQAKASKKVVDIANALNVSVDWLANGVGDMEDAGREYRPPQTRSADMEGSFIVPVYEHDTQTENIVVVPDAVKSKTCRAYVLERNSGCSEAPAGTTVVVDTAEAPGTGDLVYAKVNNNYSVYRFLDGGTDGYLSVDDERVPLIDIGSGAELIGVAVFLLRELKRRK